MISKLSDDGLILLPSSNLGEEIVVHLSTSIRDYISTQNTTHPLKFNWHLNPRSVKVDAPNYRQSYLVLLHEYTVRAQADYVTTCPPTSFQDRNSNYAL